LAMVTKVRAMAATSACCFRGGTCCSRRLHGIARSNRQVFAISCRRRTAAGAITEWACGRSNGMRSRGLRSECVPNSSRHFAALTNAMREAHGVFYWPRKTSFNSCFIQITAIQVGQRPYRSDQPVMPPPSAAGFAKSMMPQNVQIRPKPTRSDHLRTICIKCFFLLMS